jgi:P-type E1-E2 ATPase
VKAGEIVPLDGVVVSGSSHVNLSHLTGESLPVAKRGGDEVQAGARNLDGTLTLKVLRTSTDSTLSRIEQLITEAQQARPQLQKLIDRFGDKYAMSIIGLSMLFAIGLPWLSPHLPYLGKEGAIYRALTFLIAASPCALVIATPTAYLSAISSCAKKGILLKGGIILDALASCKSVAFDKTGTLTTGDLICTSFQCLTSDSDVIDAIGVAASIERHVVHPIANALIGYAQGCRAPLIKVEAFQAIPGCGIQAQVMYKQNLKSVFISGGLSADSCKSLLNL